MATSVHDSYVELLETGSVEALQAYARDLSERISVTAREQFVRYERGVPAGTKGKRAWARTIQPRLPAVRVTSGSFV